MASPQHFKIQGFLSAHAHQLQHFYMLYYSSFSITPHFIYKNSINNIWDSFISQKSHFWLKQWVDKIGNRARSCIWGKSSRDATSVPPATKGTVQNHTVIAAATHTGQEDESRDTIQLCRMFFNSAGKKPCLAKHFHNCSAFPSHIPINHTEMSGFLFPSSSNQWQEYLWMC